MKIVVCWGVLGSTYYAFVPNWRCTDNWVGRNSSSAYMVEINRTRNFTESISSIHQISENLTYWNKQCYDKTSDRKCSTFEFDAVDSTVSTEVCMGQNVRNAYIYIQYYISILKFQCFILCKFKDY